ncbi:unnamed protein product [Discosporangium mesarthrocarpum]
MIDVPIFTDSKRRASSVSSARLGFLSFFRGDRDAPIHVSTQIITPLTTPSICVGHLRRMSAAKKRAILGLYRDILKQHRVSLPPPHQELGDRYVRAEFKAHKEASGEQLGAFVMGWEGYLAQLQRQNGSVGQTLSKEDMAALSVE